ncbi:MAG TPA: hypothetical protein VKD66_09790, partial [Streptosporangiaceae bacterium]|nr:hypothetical protein [Streptosporangiaceae bacterium]
MAGQVDTVLGQVMAGHLGQTLMHEHLLIDTRTAATGRRATSPFRSGCTTATSRGETMIICTASHRQPGAGAERGDGPGVRPRGRLGAAPAGSSSSSRIASV